MSGFGPGCIYKQRTAVNKRANIIIRGFDTIHVAKILIVILAI